jgi:predicted enzyme related to lactoylglutathione lyase
MMPKPPMMPAEVPPMWGVYFAVADTDAALGRIKALGGNVLMEPIDAEPGRLAVVADPAGAVFNVIALKPGMTG